MELDEKNLRKLILLGILIALGVLTFFILRPILVSIITGLLLAYVFTPLHKHIVRFVKRPIISAAIVSIIVVLLIVVPLWFLIPPIMQQIFETFRFSQNLDVTQFVNVFLPTASEQLVTQITTTINTGISKGASAVLNYLVNFLFEFPAMSLHFLLVAFVFFYGLKDQERLREFVVDLSPFNKTQNKVLVKQFKDMTDSIMYGHFVVGLYQGITAGIGLLLFGVPNALILTLIAMAFSILPIIGPAIVYIPVTFFILNTSGVSWALAYLIYNIIVVSSLDNLIRANLISRRADISQVFVIIGTVGGILVFGILGILIGPLIIGYFLTILKAYKNRSLANMFNLESDEKE